MQYIVRTIQAFTVSLILLLSVAAAYGQLRPSISKETARHHWYATYRCSYDSALVEYTIGEFVLNDSHSSRPIYMALTVDQWRNGGSYVDVDLASIGNVHVHSAMSRTRCFRVPQNASISFFRHWFYANYYELTQQEMQEYTPTNCVDMRWLGGSGRMKDTPTVVIELVDSITGAVVMTVDSVGACNNPSNVILKRFGTAPDSSLRSVSLPNSLVDRVVYLRAMQKTTGEERYRFSIRTFPAMFNVSYLYADELSCKVGGPLPRWLLDSLVRDTLGQALYDHAIAAHEASLKEHGCRASPIGCVDRIGEYEERYEDYLKTLAQVPSRSNCEELYRADTLWWLSTLDQDLTSKRTSKTVSMVYDNTNITIAGGRAASGVSVSLRGSASRSGTFNIYDTSGKTVLTGVTPNLPFTDWKPLTSTLPNGVYILQLKLESGAELSKSFTILN